MGFFLYFTPIIQERLPDSFESSDVLSEKAFHMTLFVPHGLAYHNFKCLTKMLPIWHQYTEKAALSDKKKYSGLLLVGKENS